jgi:hypothetical protein
MAADERLGRQHRTEQVRGDAGRRDVGDTAAAARVDVVSGAPIAWSSGPMTSGGANVANAADEHDRAGTSAIRTSCRQPPA